MNGKVLCIVDPNLKDTVGHNYEYDRAILKGVEKHNYDCIILAQENVTSEIAQLLPVKKVFRKTMWDSFPRLAKIPLIGSRLNVFALGWEYFRVLRKNLSSRIVNANWIVFCHMIGPRELIAWAYWYRLLPASKRPCLILLFRYPANWYNTSSGRLALRMLEKHYADGQIRYCTDSKRLAQEFTFLTRIPLEVFPIPHTHALTTDIGENPFDFVDTTDQVCFVSLGSARDEKGILIILDAIKHLHMTNQLDGLAFILQVNDCYAFIRDAVREVENLNLPNVHFIHETLNTKDYHALLRKADVIMAPYWRSIYISRTSGIFTEAIAAGKPLIVSEDTWMSDNLKKFGSGLTCADRNPPDLAHAIVKIASDYLTYAKQAKSKQSAWLAYHNPDSFIDMLVAPSMKQVSPKKLTNIAIFYPWYDVDAQASGASKRVEFLIQYLSEHYSHIRVFSPGERPNYQVGNVSYEFFRRTRRAQSIFKYARPVFNRLMWLVTFGLAKTKDIDNYSIWLHWGSSLDQEFVKHANAIVNWADIALVEYTFQALPVIRACRRNNIPIIITPYDVLANQISLTRLLRPLLFQQEIYRLKRADHVVCVSQADADIFGKRGIQAQVIEHGIIINDLSDFSLKSEAREQLIKQHGVALPGQYVFLFVGSSHGPNVEAVGHISEIAKKLTKLQDKVHFVIAGNCTQPDSGINWTALGRVDEDVLGLLYQIADVSLIPLQHGTGSSVKTLEAMGQGKVILGTHVAFRGYPITSNVNAIVCDEIKRYPDLIRELINDPGRMQYISENSHEFARYYDYRHLYQGYRDIINLHCDGSPR